MTLKRYQFRSLSGEKRRYDRRDLHQLAHGFFGRAVRPLNDDTLPNPPLKR